MLFIFAAVGVEVLGSETAETNLRTLLLPCYLQLLGWRCWGARLRSRLWTGFTYPPAATSNNRVAPPHIISHPRVLAALPYRFEADIWSGQTHFFKYTHTWCAVTKTCKRYVQLYAEVCFLRHAWPGQKIDFAGNALHVPCLQLVLLAALLFTDRP